MLEVRGLSVSYGQHRALDDAALTVARGEIVAILGANGAGKSTLLKAVSGVCEGRVSGEVLLDGHALHELSADRIVEEGIAFVPEERGIFGDLTVEENLKLGAYPDRARSDEAANLDRVFALFPVLSERRRQVARTMSGGEQQMVAIGRAMMSSPQILTLDEPSLGLAPILCKELFNNLAQIRDLGMGTLMVEQNAKLSLSIADRGYLLENARIIHEAAADELMGDAAVQAAYLGGDASEISSRPAVPVSHSDHAVPKSVLPRCIATDRKKSDGLAGIDISQLVTKASAVSKAAAKPPAMTAVPDGIRLSKAPRGSSDVQTMLKEFEIAAERARRPKQEPIVAENLNSLLEKPVRVSEESPVTIEVYRRPRVEVYRRKPGGRSFERD